MDKANGLFCQVKELCRIAKMWQAPERYVGEQDMPHVVLFIEKTHSKKKSLVDGFIQETGLKVVRPDDREFPQDFQGWVKHTVVSAMSLFASNMMGAIALIEDLDHKLTAATRQAFGSPLEIFEFEMGVPKECGLVVVTSHSERPLSALIKKGCFDYIVRS